MTTAAWATAALILLSGCTSRPVDPEGTLDRVRGGTLRVGITANDPWVVVADPPGGIEVALVNEFAASIDASLTWIDGSEEELFGALRHGELDLVIGGLGAKNPYVTEAAFTHPYFTSRVVVAVPANEQVPDDIAGLEIAVERGTEAAGILGKSDARRVLVEDVTQVDGARAIEDWLLDDYGLADTGVTLLETDHVMALRMGENGFMVELEDFLLSNEGLVERIVDEEGSP